MLKHKWIAVPVMAITLAVAGCDDDETGPQPERYSSAMNGANEAPTPVTTPATGTGTFTVNGTNVDFSITTTGFPAGRVFSGAHIHKGTATEAGPVRLPFPAITLNGTTTGSVVAPDSVLTMIRNGQTYFNIHTAAAAPSNGFPGGEIRGPLVRQ